MGLLVVLYLVLGMFFDSMSMMLLTLPFVMPVLANLGYDPRLVGSHVCGFDRSRTRHPSIWSKFVYDSWGSSPIFRYVYSRSSLPLLGTMILMVWIPVFFSKLALWLPKILY
jgi:TRAP-type C4-dicarboxylate transport system permease large subunit